MADTFHLLVPTTTPASNCVTVGTHRWHVVSGKSWLAEDKTRNYICVSYAWGDDKMGNDLHGGKNEMSIRTKQVLETATQTIHEATAVWIDAYCLPPRGDPSRSLSLERMGDFYAGSAKVVVVLSKESGSFLKLAKNGIKKRETQMGIS